MVNETFSAYELLTDADTRKFRASAVLACGLRLKHYSDILQATRGELGKKTAVSGLAVQLPDLAYNAEKYARILAKVGLDTLNDLRDSGYLESTVSSLVSKLQQEGRHNSKQQGRNWITATIEELERARADPSIASMSGVSILFDEVERLIRDWQLHLSADGRDLIVNFVAPDRGRHRLIIHPDRRAGSQGRVSTTTFFAPPKLNKLSVAAWVTPIGISTRLFESRPKPSRATEAASADHEIDLYAAVVRQLAALREMVYHHARTIEEMGPSAYAGNSVLAGIAVVVGLACVAIGIYTGEEILTGIGFGILLVLCFEVPALQMVCTAGASGGAVALAIPV